MSEPDKGGPELRQHRRFPVDWRVTLRVPSWGVEIHVAAQNASRGGLFVLTARPPPPGAAVELDVELPDGARTRLTGTVQHVVTPERAIVEGRSPGIGVRVEERHALDLMLLEEMASAAGAARPAELPPAPAPQPRTVARVHVVGVAAARVVGLDLGAWTTRLGCVVGERVTVACAVPSVVAFPEGEEPLLGWAARQHLGRDPHRTVTHVKRLLGRRLGDADVLPTLTYATVAGADGAIQIDLGGGARRPAVEVAALVVAHARASAEAALRRPVAQAVLSCPAAAGDGERAALRRASELAGIEVVELVDEPLAAARAFGAGRAGGELCAVIDLGGSRCTVSVVELQGARARILCVEEDPHLGGEDLDEAVADLVADAYWRETQVELRGSVVLWQRLLLLCEDQRRRMAAEPDAALELAGVVVSRPEVEAATRGLVERALAACGRALERCALRPEALARVVPAGGVASLPALRRELERFFGRPLEGGVAPEEAVVSGAARLGAAL